MTLIVLAGLLCASATGADDVRARAGEPTAVVSVLPRALPRSGAPKPFRPDWCRDAWVAAPVERSSSWGGGQVDYAAGCDGRPGPSVADSIEPSGISLSGLIALCMLPVIGTLGLFALYLHGMRTMPQAPPMRCPRLPVEPAERSA